MNNKTMHTTIRLPCGVVHAWVGQKHLNEVEGIL